MSNIEKIFSSQDYLLTNNELIFASSARSIDDGVQEHQFYLDVLGNDKWHFQLTDLTNIRVTRKRVLEQFDDIDAIVFFVDLLDNNEANPILPEIFGEYANSAVFANTPVMIVGYNKGLANDYLVKDGHYPSVDAIQESVVRPYLEKRNKNVNCQFVHLNSVAEVEIVLNSIISMKTNSL